MGQPGSGRRAADGLRTGAARQGLGSCRVPAERFGGLHEPGNELRLLGRELE